MTTRAQRAHLHDLMRFLITREPLVNYPTHDVRGPKDAATFALSEHEMRAELALGHHIQFDCSQAVTQLCRWAGLSDPNGLGYDHAGYTGTLLAHLPHYKNPRGAMCGALVVYGPGTGEHVSMVYEPGDDPLLWSHGLDAGPQLVRLSRQRTYHASPVTFLSIAAL